MKRYDIILIETAHYKLPHYEKIQRQIAELLTMGGLKVAVINYKTDNNFHKDRIYDVINVTPGVANPPIISKDRKRRNKFERFLSKRRLAKEEKKYFEILLKKINHLSNALYWGTISGSTFNLLKIKTLKDKKIFLWEGAYYAFLFTDLLKKSNLHILLKNILLKKYIIRKGINILVANEPIYNVLIQKGFKSRNLIMRPEETFEELNKKPEISQNEFCLTTIGAIRREKNIHFALDALKNRKIKFVVAGKSNNQYAINLDKKIARLDSKYFIRINKWFSDEEYHQLIRQSHFLVICDINLKYPGSNGTLYDAIKNMRPIIVPNHTHFKYYIDKYKIGLKYEPDNVSSFLEAVEQAKQLGTSFFLNNIFEMRNDFKKDKVVREFTNDMVAHIK